METDRIAARRARREAERRLMRRWAIGAALGALAIFAVAAAVLALRASAAQQARAAAPERTLPAAAPAPSATPTPSVESTQPSAPATITVSAVGDMIFDRAVRDLIAKKGGTAPFADVASRLAASDITVGNLESPLSASGSQEPSKSVTFRGTPKAIEGLKAAGFDLVSLANNHALDYGKTALADTIGALDAAGVAHAGAGPDRGSAYAPAIVVRKGARIAYLAFSDVVPPGFAADARRGGIATGRTLRTVTDAVRKAKTEADYVIVSFHWGVEYKDDATAQQVHDAHAVIDAGADMVAAHHPHVIQAVEMYKGKVIAYSLGDFVFDHFSRKTGEAFILDASIGPAGIGAVTVTPVYLDTSGKPAIVEGAAAAAILQRLRTISAKRNTDVVIQGSTATVTAR
jgi:poly-gamma-glutamate capsule biosynthesis protein CapA/YwtB (metallophosphatase superfamily)